MHKALLAIDEVFSGVPELEGDALHFEVKFERAGKDVREWQSKEYYYGDDGEGIPESLAQEAAECAAQAMHACFQGEAEVQQWSVTVVAWHAW